MIKSKILNSSVGKFVFSAILLISLTAVVMLKLTDLAYGFSNYKEQVNELKQDYINEQKERVKSEIYVISEQIRIRYDDEFESFKNSVRQKAFEGLNIARAIRSQTNQKRSDSALDAVTSELKSLGGYSVYAYNETPILGDDFIDPQTASKLVFNAQNNNTQLVKYTMSGRNFIAYAVLYESLNIIIAYSADLSAFDANFLAQTKSRLKSLSKSVDEYYFLLNTNEGRILLENHSELENIKFSALNDKRSLAYEQMATLAQNAPNEGFVSFEQLRLNGTRALKESFVKDVGIFNWAVGAGVFLDQVNEAIAPQRQMIFNKLVYKSIILSVYFLVVLALLVSTAKYIKGLFDTSLAKFSQCLGQNGLQRIIDIDGIVFKELRQIAKWVNGIIAQRDDLQERHERSALMLTQYQNSVESSATVFKFSPYGTITFANNAFCELLGFLKKEIVGKNNKILFDEQLNLGIKEQVAKGIASKNEWQGTVRARRKNGEICHVKVSVTPIAQNANIIEYICICQDITELIRQRERLQNHLKDGLTGLPNRQALIDRLNENLRHSVVANFDILRFKQINECYGFTMGDAVLQNVTNEIKILLKGRNLELFKLTNDGFAILGDTREWDIDSFCATCERIMEHFKTTPVTVGENKFYIELVFGISSQACFFITSEMAKDHAKQTKQPLVVFDDKRDMLINNVNLTQGLKRAIDEDRIVLYKQAIVDNLTGKTTKYECLIRMIDEDRNVVSPINFLGLAKNSNLYQQLTKIVIEKSFKYFSKNDEEFSINLAIEDILSPKFLSFLKENLEKYEDIGRRLTIEIVEDEGIENFEQVNSFIATVREFGCKVAIDDFGTGYSNFEYLMKIKADIIKIDGSMIRNIDQDINSRKVVELMVEFTRHLGVKTVAEYVHSNSVLNTVNAIGIDSSQGYFFEQPKPLEA